MHERWTFVVYEVHPFSNLVGNFDFVAVIELIESLGEVPSFDEFSDHAQLLLHTNPDQQQEP